MAGGVCTEGIGDFVVPICNAEAFISHQIAKVVYVSKFSQRQIELHKAKLHAISLEFAIAWRSPGIETVYFSQPLGRGCRAYGEHINAGPGDVDALLDGCTILKC